MRTLYLLTGLAFVTASSAQSIQWFRDGGAPTGISNYEQADAVAVDDQGNAYVTGWVQGYSEFDAISVTVVRDCYIARYDPAGTVQWVSTFGGPSNSMEVMARRIKVDPNEGVYVCGHLTSMPLDSIAVFGADTVFMGGYEVHAFLAKYDLNGNFLWVRHGGGEPYGALATDLDIDDQGNIVVVGELRYTSTFSGQTITNTTFRDQGLLLKYAPDGTLLSHTTFASNSSYVRLRAVEVAPISGDIHLGGEYGGTVDFNGATVTATGTGPVFVAKLNNSGQGQWVVGGSNNSPGYGISVAGLAIDAFGNTYVAGGAAGTNVQFGTQSFTGPDPYTAEVYTAKVNAAGVVQWIRHGGSIRSDEAYDIITDDVGNSVISGFLGGNILTAEFDGTVIDILSQEAHCFLARYDPDGNLAYARRMGSGNGESGRGLALVGDSAFYLCGITSGTTIFDTLTNVACCWENNLYIARFADEFQSTSLGIGDDAVPVQTSHLAYPNPARDRITLNKVASGTTVEFFDALGQRVFTTRGRSIDVSAWSEGIYFVKVEGITQRIIINH